MGLRGRLAILSEGYSNADFRTRISATYNFVHEVLAFAVEQRATIKSSIQAATRQQPESVTVRSVLGPPTEQEVVAEITEPAGEGAGGFARRKRTGVYRPVRMPVFDRFVPGRREALPAAYLVPSRFADIIGLLRRQGIVVESVTAAARIRAARFHIDSVVVDPLFEGHRTVQVEGRWQKEPLDTTVGPGWYLLRTAQPLGVLAAYLLEPSSEDGVVTWNLLDRELAAGAMHPFLRVSPAPEVPTIAIP
jgi:hypothetical protein